MTFLKQIKNITHFKLFNRFFDDESIPLLSSFFFSSPVAGATHIENPSFHACVDTTHLEKRKVLRVLPPPDQVSCVNK